MFNHRFFPYVIGVCIVALISVSYVGYRAYQKHIELQAFMSNAQEFNRSIEEGHVHSSEAPLPVSKAEMEQKASEYNHQKKTDHEATFVSEVSATKIETDMPMSKEYLEIQHWVMTGETTPYVEQKLKERAKSQLYLVAQRVVTPDGQIHAVVVHQDYQYEDGDQILKAQLQPPDEEFVEHASIIIDDVEYDLPEEYYSIEDPYERRVYTEKFWWSVENGVSMAEVEKKVAKGELDFSLSQADKGYIDEEVAREERHRLLLQRQKPPLSDKPPVKVSFLPDEGDGTLPLGSDAAVDGREHVATDIISEGDTPVDTDTAPVRSDVPVSPLDSPDMVKPISPQSVEGIEKQLAPAGIEAELSEGVSPERFSKAQQLIDQYGTEEGLRRLREMDPEAARRFERGHPPQSPREQGEGSRTVPDGGQSESESKN